MSGSISVVIPLYNKVRHINRAVDSVLGQTFEDFELIIVDDGSTDGSGDAVRRYDDPRIRLIVQANSGVSAARNRGVAEAKFELVAFLDADDEWLPDFLETVLKLRNQFPKASVWATSYSVVGSDGIHLQVAFPGTDEASREGGLIDYFKSSGPWRPVHASAVMVQKGALTKAGGFPVELRCGEDSDTWVRMALRYPIAWWPAAKALLHQDAENRTDDYCYTGVYLYARSLNEFFKEGDEKRSLDIYIRRYIARCHMKSLKGNWLAGDRAAMNTIFADLRKIKGARLKSLIWRCLYYLPHCVVTTAWKLRQRIAGRSSGLPTFRDVRRT